MTVTRNNGGPRMADQLAEVLKLIDADYTAKREAVGRVPCPICKAGIIGYSIAGKRSMAARCSTPGCIAVLS